MLLPVFYKPIVFPGVNRAKSFLNFDFNFDFFFSSPFQSSLMPSFTAVNLRALLGC